MSDKYSSDKQMQKLFEGFRSHTEEVHKSVIEEEDAQKKEKEEEGKKDRQRKQGEKRAQHGKRASYLKEDEEQLDEGLMDTLNYLFTGKTPSELDLIQRELDKAKANLSKASMVSGKPRKPPADDSKDRELQLKLMKLKAARKASE